MNNNRRTSSEDIAEILDGIIQLKAKARTHDLRTLSHLLDIAELETVRVIHPGETSEANGARDRHPAKGPSYSEVF